MKKIALLIRAVDQMSKVKLALLVTALAIIAVILSLLIQLGL